MAFLKRNYPKFNVFKICVLNLCWINPNMTVQNRHFLILTGCRKKARIIFKILANMYNCSVGNAPSYLTELLCLKQSKRVLRSSESSVNCYALPFNKNKTFSDRSFSTIGPKLWNDLPVSLRRCDSVDSFKSQLKSFYFEDYFALFWIFYIVLCIYLSFFCVQRHWICLCRNRRFIKYTSFKVSLLLKYSQLEASIHQSIKTIIL